MIKPVPNCEYRFQYRIGIAKLYSTQITVIKVHMQSFYSDTYTTVVIQLSYY